MDKDTLALATEILGEEEVARMQRAHRLPPRKPVFGASPAHKLPPATPVKRDSSFVHAELQKIITALQTVDDGIYLHVGGMHPGDRKRLKQASDRLTWVVSTASTESEPVVREPGVASASVKRLGRFIDDVRP